MIWPAVTVLASALLIGGLALGMPSIERQLNRWQLLPTHQQLTELSVNDPESLPKTYQAGQTLPVSFSIANRTTVLRTYSYRITESNATSMQTIELASGSIDIADGDAAAILKNVTPQNMGKQVNIKITLVGENGLNLNYWLARN